MTDALPSAAVAQPGEVSSCFRLDGRLAVVTGAASGIGHEIGRMFAEAGATVVAVDIDPRVATADALAALGRRARGYVADVASADVVEETVRRISAETGVPDVVVASAGVSLEAAALDVSETDWGRVIDVNLKGTFFTCQSFARRMLAGGETGSIVLIASNFGQVGFPNRAPYVAAKAGLLGLARALALEWAPRVRVNAVCPCLVRTPMVTDRLRDAEYAERMLSRIPLGRFAEPSDVAAAVLFLASSASSMITGHALSVDGGWTAQ